MNEILYGDSLEVLKTLENNSIDSIVTDPPYGLKFMGKKWDYNVPSVEVWQECLRVLKAGGHLLSFAGTRTQHRMAVNIEDAGFEIRDMIAWVYGSGFPKSLNIGKAIDKMKGAEREKVVNPKAKQQTKAIGTNVLGDYNAVDFIYPNAVTNEAKQYEGWGTAFKPALEPITVARKPLSEKTIAENVLKHGTGGINIDGCRVDLAGIAKTKGGCNSKDSMFFGAGNKTKEDNSKGRWPANFIHDGSDEVVGLFPETISKWSKQKQEPNPKDSMFGMVGTTMNNFVGDSGSASRFFYCAKASKSERNKGLENNINKHPTVKPISLMRYLARLVTPPNGICLDPFCGSGSTLIACKIEGFNYLGIEKEKEYIDIANARIKAWQKEPEQQNLSMVL
ncbi:MAG: DNA-methyltransferase [Candidatus Anammoxibacter sp.]